MHSPAFVLRAGLHAAARLAAAGVLALGIALVAVPRVAMAADPSPSPSTTPTTPAPTPTPSATTAPAPTAPPTAAPTSTASAGQTAPPPEASPTPDITGEDAAPSHSPTPTPQPTPTPEPTPTTPTATPTPTPTPPPPPPPPPPAAPPSMNLFVSSGFRFQDPNMNACTSTAARSMLNFIAARGTGGEGFLWQPTNSGAVRDSMLAWERAHDTLPKGRGSDPHGWRNALNYYGWGPATLMAGSRVYDDVSFGTFGGAMKAAVRALIATGKPIGVLGWGGAHAQMITGYWGLVGDPFAKDPDGRWANDFKVGGFYLTDPLRERHMVNKGVSWDRLKTARSYKVRFRRYYETDSRYDDPYTPGWRRSRDEWYRRFVLVLPVR